MDDAIKDTLGVEKLILSHNHLDKNAVQFSSIPEEILLFRNIEQLYFSKHAIDTLPAGFENLKKMKILHLTMNNLNHFPLQICSLLNLEELDLSINRISNIPDCVCQLKKLKVLRIGSNYLSQIPDCIEELDSLLLLSILKSKFDSLPHQILKIKSLINLDIASSEITFLPENIGSKLNNLRTLSINYTSIKLIPESLLNLEKMFLLVTPGSPFLPDEEFEKLLNHSKNNPNWKVYY